MKVYHARNTRSLRILWLLEELGLPYEVEIFDLGAPDMRSEAYRKVHPHGPSAGPGGRGRVAP
jgi:Glutathione S-transferase